MGRKSFSSNDINNPNHKAEFAELAVGFAAVLSALATAVILLEFHPERK